MTSKELTELIHQNTRVILPEFGAFLVKDGGDKGFNPANVSFSPFLRYNDGMLEVYVSKSKGISKEEASKVVRKFVETLKNELLEKGFYEVEGLGDLKRDQRGSLSFSLIRSDDQTRKINKALTIEDTPKTDPIIPLPQVETKDEKSDAWRIEDKQLDQSEEDKKPRRITSEKAKVEKMTTSKKAKPTVTPTKEPKPEPINTIGTDTSVEVEPLNRIDDSQIIQPSNEERIIEPIPIETKSTAQIEEIGSPISEKKDIQVDTIPKKKNRLLYTIIAIAIAVLLFFVIKSYYFPPNIEDVKENSTVLNEQKNSSNNVEAKEKVDKPKDEIDKAFNEVSNDTEPIKEQLKKQKEQEDAIAKTLIENSKVKAEEKSTISGIRYYIIAGSFKNPDFANKFVNELKSKGYNSSVVIQTSGMNAVNIGSYTSRDEAIKAIKEFKSKLPNLWILKK